MANTTARFDPSIVVDVQFRVARDGTIVFEFYDSDGNPEDMYESEWEFILKKQAGAPTNVLRLTTGAGNISVSGDSDEKVTITLTAALSNIPAYNYYYEIYRPDLRKTWFTGTCFASNGQYNASVNQEYVSISTDEQVVRIELSSSGSPVQVNLGVPSEQDTTLQQAYTNGDGTIKLISGKPLEILNTDGTQVPLYIDILGNIQLIGNDNTSLIELRVGAITDTYLLMSKTALAFISPQISLAPTTSLIVTIPETVLTSASTIDIARSNNTLATALAAITLTISSTSTFTRTVITLTATSLVLTLPANSLGVNSDGTASGTNTCTLSGVSGDVYEVMTARRGATYSVIAKNLGQ